MLIYLIRHTQPDVPKGICYGRTDLDVAHSFESEATAVQRVLPSVTDRTRIISSPLLRCRKLADFLAKGHLVSEDDRLAEINFGEWEMQPWKSIGQEILLAWRQQFVDVPSPAGEAYRTVYERAMNLRTELAYLDADQVFLVTHSGIIRAFLCHYNQIPLDQAFDEQFGYGVVFEVENDLVQRIK